MLNLVSINLSLLFFFVHIFLASAARSAFVHITMTWKECALGTYCVWGSGFQVLKWIPWLKEICFRWWLSLCCWGSFYSACVQSQLCEWLKPGKMTTQTKPRSLLSFVLPSRNWSLFTAEQMSDNTTHFLVFVWEHLDLVFWSFSICACLNCSK